MEKYVSSATNIDEVIAKHGPWSAMAVKIGQEQYTRDDQVDHRLRRLLQIASDTVGKPLNECRVLDLACLEGHYAIEFAMHGAQAVGVELREDNIVKAAFAAQALGLTNAEFYMDDVNNLNVEQYGQFDIIICSGILYHLRGEDACALIGKMRECCTGIMLLDLLIASDERASITYGGKKIGGSTYKEHDDGASKGDKLVDLWASVDNDESFWLSEASIVTVMQDAGFSSCSEVLGPTMPGLAYDRRTYLGMCGTPVEIMSSEATNAMASPDAIQRDPTRIHPSQRHRSVAFKLAKTFLPQNVKNMIKPTLRKIGILDTRERPEFLSTKENT